MDYLTADVKDALHEEGLAFCQEHSIIHGTFDGEEIVNVDSIREVLGRAQLNPSRYCFMHEVPHIVWNLTQ